MQDEILKITPPSLPYDLEDKIFFNIDDEGNIIGEPYSYMDSVRMLNNISGINPDLLGKYD